MKIKIESYHNRAEFANQMLDKYYQKAPNYIVSDIGAGFGHMRAKVESLGAVWQPFDYIQKMDYSIIWNLNNPAPKEANKAGTVVF